MPGRLVMDQQGAIGSIDLRKDRSQAQHANLPPKPDFAQSFDAANGSVSNGTPAQDVSPPPTTNGQSTNATLTLRAPPALDQSWRQSDSNKSMGTLIDRLAHQCFEDLSTEITKMVDAPATSQENGVIPRSDDPAVAKKRTFMEFANGQRDRFIKTLVLSDWARHAGDDMAKLVDIKLWQEKQATAQRNAINFLGITKHDVGRSKIPNPNINGALQLLATGKASSKVPDLGYIAPERLTARQLLRTLQDMNVALATRLNVHEELPAHFNDFSIANGRATFRVPGEFEVDLSVADEDTSSPFYFIDVRFLFSPAPRVVDEVLRGALEMRSNAELATKGLQGCYYFLHNYVLTHKINVLRDQAQQMHRDKWFDCVKLEWKHRVLTLQYWTGQRGKKSWLEFGINTGKTKENRSRRSPTPQLSVRWFRRGQLVENEPIDIDWQHLDLEKMLLKVVARHASWLLTQVRSRLLTLAGAHSRLEIDLKTSATEPENCSLTLHLPSMESPLVVRLEPITGRLGISPSTGRAAHEEHRINNDPDPDLARSLANLLCKTVEDRIGKAARLTGWIILDPRSIKQDNFKSLFGTGPRSWKAYICNKAWGESWTVLVTYSLSGERWWIARLERIANAAGNPTSIVTNAREIATHNTSVSKSNISRTSMLQIEKLAASEVSFTVLSQQLSSMQIPHRLEKQALLTFEDSSANVQSATTVAVFFRGATLFKDSLGKEFVIDSIKITHQGIMLGHEGNRESPECSQQIRLSVETGRLKHLREFLASRSRSGSGNLDIAMNASGALALRFRTPFGQPYMEQILDRLRACERLDRYLTVMQSFQFECTMATLHKLTFIYNRSANLSATFTFPRGDGNYPAKLKLQPIGSNPHQRTRVMLERIFNHRNLSEPFIVLCKSLHHSVGVLEAFERMESAHRHNRSLVIHPRNPLFFTVTYKAPLAGLAFNIELRERKEKSRSIVAWKIKADKTKHELQSSETGKAILELAKQKGKDWWGFEDGTLSSTSSQGAGEILEKLDQIMRNSSSSHGGNADSAPKSKVESSLPTPAQQQPQQPAEQTAAQQQPPPSKPGPPKPNAHALTDAARTASAKANATPNGNPTGARNKPVKVKNEIIELD